MVGVACGARSDGIYTYNADGSFFSKGNTFTENMLKDGIPGSTSVVESTHTNIEVSTYDETNSDRYINGQYQGEE